jgi:hypothetical protein
MSSLLILLIGIINLLFSSVADAFLDHGPYWKKNMYSNLLMTPTLRPTSF